MNLNHAKGNLASIAKALPELFVAYEADIADAPDRLAILGKTSAQAESDQCAWPVYYGVRKAELTKLAKFLKSRIDAIRGELTRKYVDCSRDYGERTREKFIDAEPEYLQMHELWLEVEELRDKFDVICEAFIRRGFALRDWTQVRTSDVTDPTIR